jgi:hypothetical protein
MTFIEALASLGIALLTVLVFDAGWHFAVVVPMRRRHAAERAALRRSP